MCWPEGDTRLLLAFALVVGGGACLICYASVGPDPWVVYSNFAFLVPAAAAWLRHRRWFVCVLLLLTGAASVTYHESATTQSSFSDSKDTLYQLLQKIDHIAAVYTTAVVLTLPFLPTPDSQIANRLALVLALGPSVVAVWYTVETDFETITSVAVTLGTLLFSHWMQLVYTVWRLGGDWHRAQALNLVGQALPPLAIGIPLGLLGAWDPYTFASIVGVALFWPFIMQIILVRMSSQWKRTSLGLTLRQFDIHPLRAWTFILIVLLLSVGALALLWHPDTTNDWRWHGLWHFLAASSATFVIWNSPAPSIASYDHLSTGSLDTFY